MSEQRGRVRVEPGHKRVRAFLGGALVADTTRPLLVWENPHYPAYYLPLPDVRQELLESSTRTEHSPSRGEARYYSVRVGTRRAEDAAWTYPESPIEDLRGTLRVEWDAMDGWFEEDEEVFVHPRSPYTRVDILASSRHVEVVVEGQGVRDRIAGPLLRPPGRRAPGPPGPVRDDDGVPLQGLRPLLVGHDGGRRRRGRGLVVSDPAPREPEDRRLGLLLQRAGRPRRGR